jgi:hypothetical protein
LDKQGAQVSEPPFYLCMVPDRLTQAVSDQAIQAQDTASVIFILHYMRDDGKAVNSMCGDGVVVYK